MERTENADAKGRLAAAGYAYLLARENRHGKVEVVGVTAETADDVRGEILYSEVAPDDVGGQWSNRKRNVAARWGTEYDATQTTVAEAVRRARGGDAPRPTRGYA